MVPVGDKFNAELPSLTYVRAIKPKAFTKSQKYCSRPTLNQARAEEWWKPFTGIIHLVSTQNLPRYAYVRMRLKRQKSRSEVFTFLRKALYMNFDKGRVLMCSACLYSVIILWFGCVDKMFKHTQKFGFCRRIVCLTIFEYWRLKC